MRQVRGRGCGDARIAHLCGGSLLERLGHLVAEHPRRNRQRAAEECHRELPLLVRRRRRQAERHRGHLRRAFQRGRDRSHRCRSHRRSSHRRRSLGRVTTGRRHLHNRRGRRSRLHARRRHRSRLATACGLLAGSRLSWDRRVHDRRRRSVPEVQRDVFAVARLCQARHLHLDRQNQFGGRRLSCRSRSGGERRSLLRWRRLLLVGLEARHKGLDELVGHADARRNHLEPDARQPSQLLGPISLRLQRLQIALHRVNWWLGSRRRCRRRVGRAGERIPEDDLDIVALRRLQLAHHLHLHLPRLHHRRRLYRGPSGGWPFDHGRRRGRRHGCRRWRGRCLRRGRRWRL